MNHLRYDLSSRKKSQQIENVYNEIFIIIIIWQSKSRKFNKNANEQNGCVKFIGSIGHGTWGAVCLVIKILVIIWFKHK